MNKMSKNKAEENLDTVISQIEQARLKVSAHHIVSLVAISKYNTSEDIKNLYFAGQRAFGENKVQDLKTKMQELESLPIAWHFVGHLQKNKISALIELEPYLFHGLDSLELAFELNKKLENKNKNMACLLQVNSSYEKSKSGFSPKHCLDAYRNIEKNCPRIQLQGLMCIGANSKNKDEIKKSFLLTKKFYEETKKEFNAKICSMGMSNDFQEAIECGSNMIRIGSALFKEFKEFK